MTYVRDVVTLINRYDIIVNTLANGIPFDVSDLRISYSFDINIIIYACILYTLL